MAVIHFYFLHIVCGKLCVHLAQPDIPAGGRSSYLVQQDHVFGPITHQDKQPECHQPHQLLQSSVQIASPEGERQISKFSRPFLLSACSQTNITAVAICLPVRAPLKV